MINHWTCDSRKFILAYRVFFDTLVARDKRYLRSIRRRPQMHMSQRFFTFIALLCSMSIAVVGQSPIKLVDFVGTQTDSERTATDSLKSLTYDPPQTDRFRPRSNGSCIYGSAIGGYLTGHPWYRLDIPMQSWLIAPRKRPATDWMFYLFIACLLYIGWMRLAFPRYMGDLFLVFRNVVHRQKQLRDQVSQNLLPSLLLNFFFSISAGIFLFFLWRPDLRNLEWPPLLSIPMLVLLLMIIGIGKYLLLQLAGWLSGRQKEASAYAFIVFMVNKVGGILLLPLSLMLAYRTDQDRSFWVNIALILVAILFLIRLVRAYDYVSKELKVNILHFLFMVFSFEVLPILLIAKALGDRFL